MFMDNFVGQLPYEVEIDSQDIISRLQNDASNYCDQKCHGMYCFSIRLH